jgi:hypothetical protein
MRCMPKSESRVSTLLFEPRPWGKLHCFQVFLLLRCRYSQPVSNNLSHHSNTFLKVATFKCNSSSSGEIAHAFGYMLRQSGRQASFSLRHLYLLLPTHVCTGIRNFCESCHKHGACSTTRSHPATETHPFRVRMDCKSDSGAQTRMQQNAPAKWFCPYLQVATHSP